MSAFTGGGGVGRGAEKSGGRPEVCSVFKYKFYLFEKDDRKLDELAERCRRGEILCGECKKSLADVIVPFIEEHQAKREKAKEQVEEFMLRDCDEARADRHPLG
jgi:tryptophanyl-tRNA synthetase